LRETALALGYISAAEFVRAIDPALVAGDVCGGDFPGGAHGE
jgi:hypothetical protein